jgi:hypothetical protein
MRLGFLGFRRSVTAFARRFRITFELRRESQQRAKAVSQPPHSRTQASFGSFIRATKKQAATSSRPFGTWGSFRAKPGVETPCYGVFETYGIVPVIALQCSASTSQVSPGNASHPCSEPISLKSLGLRSRRYCFHTLEFRTVAVQKSSLVPVSVMRKT